MGQIKHAELQWQIQDLGKVGGARWYYSSVLHALTMLTQLATSVELAKNHTDFAL